MSLPGGAGSPGQGVHPEPRAAGSANRVHPEPEFIWAPGLPGTRMVRGHPRVPDKSGPGHTGRTQVRCPDPCSVSVKTDHSEPLFRVVVLCVFCVFLACRSSLTFSEPLSCLSLHTRVLNTCFLGPAGHRRF